MAALRLVMDALPAICEAVGEHSLCVSVWGNHGPTTVYWEASSRPVSENLRAGLVMNATNSAAGRAFCASLPKELTRPFVEEDLRLFRGPGEEDETQREAFEVEMEATRARGLSRAVDPSPASQLHKIPTIAFAAPIFDASGAMVMAVSMVSPVDRLDPDWSGAAPVALSRACQELNARLSVA